MTENQLHRGHPTVRETTFVPLDWQEARLQRLNTVGEVVALLPPKPGVYVIEGARDGQPAPGVLYVGQCGARGDNARRPLATRVRESLRRVLRTNGYNDEITPWSNYWDLVLRWATLDTECILAVEMLLIYGHMPPLNGQGVRGKWLPPSSDHVVLNVGSKGRLLPVIASHYFRDDCWRGDDEDPAPEERVEVASTNESAASIVPLDEALDAFRRKYIFEALERCGGNRTRAARALGVDPRTVFRYLEADSKDG